MRSSTVIVAILRKFFSRSKCQKCWYCQYVGMTLRRTAANLKLEFRGYLVILVEARNIGTPAEIVRSLGSLGTTDGWAGSHRSNTCQRKTRITVTKITAKFVVAGSGIFALEPAA